ncbi:hypothetical protein OAO42_01020 [Candidatus Izimaplasma bacterium]|nr:hypothetical protein [Candidatus Izimaplasma bacterium]
MRSFKVIIYVEIGIGIANMVLLLFAYINSNYLLTFIGIFILLVSILLYFGTKTVEMFKKDKELDIIELKKQGLTIVQCVNCGKSNVFEDKFCIFCGEDLKNVN